MKPKSHLSFFHPWLNCQLNCILQRIIQCHFEDIGQKNPQQFTSLFNFIWEAYFMTWFPLLIYMWAGSSKWGTFLTPYMLSILQLKCRHCLAAMQTCDHRTCSSVRCHTRHHLQVSSSQSPEMFFHNAGEMFPHACWLFWISFFNSS